MCADYLWLHIFILTAIHTHTNTYTNAYAFMSHNNWPFKLFISSLRWSVLCVLLFKICNFNFTFDSFDFTFLLQAITLRICHWNFMSAISNGNRSLKLISQMNFWHIFFLLFITVNAIHGLWLKYVIFHPANGDALECVILNQTAYICFLLKLFELRNKTENLHSSIVYDNDFSMVFFFSERDAMQWCHALWKLKQFKCFFVSFASFYYYWIDINF